MYQKLFSTTGLSYERLRAFLDIAEAKGISRAARGNPSRQSQLSRQLAELEQFFNTSLVNRGRGIPFRLTETGSQLKAIADQHLSAVSELQNAATTESTACRVAAGEVLLTWLVIPSLARHKAVIESARISLLNRRSEDIVAGVSDGSLELGIIRRAPVGAAIKAASLGTVSLFLVKPLLFNHREFPVAVMEDGKQSDAARAKGPGGRPMFYCSSYQQISELVKQKCCSGVLPSFIAREFPQSEFGLEPVKNSDLEWRLQVIYSPRLMKQRPTTARIIAQLTEAFQQTLAAPLTKKK